VRAGDLEEARQTLARALSESIQVTFGDAYWTLSPSELGRFVDQRVDPTKRGAAAFSLGLDEARLAQWLQADLGPEIDREPVDAKVGWNWDAQGLVSTEPSVDGARLEPAPSAKAVAESFFGDHGLVPLAVTVTKPEIDSANLGKLGVVTLLGVGTSNYAGSDAGRATNVEVGAYLLNGTLVPPGGEFSFNHAIGVINEANGFVEAQVIDGENIGKDIGGGICQVSTTVFRAAYMAGLQMGQWHPHRFRIPFYEADGWAPGLDASILQPTEDPSTWGDFTFINPSDSWMLVESWSTGVNVVVNIYGADLGYVVDTQGPIFGEPTRIEPDKEIVDPELEPGTIDLTQTPLEGVTVEHYRRIFDRDGNILREGPFKTTYFPRGNVWKVSPDMKGKSDADPDRPLPTPKPPPADEGAMQDVADGEAVVDGVSVEEPIPAEQPGTAAPAAEEPVYEDAAPAVEATIGEDVPYEEVAPAAEVPVEDPAAGDDGW
jgi:vancomycin resistance protein YoaR